MNRRQRVIIVVLFSCIALVSLFMLGRYYLNSRQQAQQQEALKALKPDITPRPPIEEIAETAPALQTLTDPQTGAAVELLPDFEALYLKNNDLVGWLTIPGTDIDYPVMQTPDRPDYYLTRDFDRQPSSYGCIYARELCDVFLPSDNITLYGHRMKDGTMFSQLDRYMDRSFYEENPYLYFDTLRELRTYEVMAVFLTAATEEGFDYHNFVEADDEAEFHRFVSTCQDLALYDTGVEATYGDSFLTLSTCEYSQTNGRLVIVAIRRDHYAAD